MKFPAEVYRSQLFPDRGDIYEQTSRLQKNRNTAEDMTETQTVLITNPSALINCVIVHFIKVCHGEKKDKQNIFRKQIK